MKKDELKKLSNDTFFDNNTGGITAESHRAFNTALIESIPDPIEIATNSALGTVKGSVKPGGISIASDGSMSVNAYVAQATFVVASNEALAAWANNTAGNDYSIVAITRGTWQSDTGVNLTSTKTKVVIGLPGSELLFTSSRCLYYDECPNTPDYFMEGVTLLANRKSTASEAIHGFDNATNLYRCIVKRTVKNTALSGYIYMFAGCKNLYQCFAYYPDFQDTRTLRVYYSCDNLNSCSFDINAANAPDQIVIKGYNRITNMVNCNGKITMNISASIGGTAMAESIIGAIGCTMEIIDDSLNSILFSNGQRMLFCNAVIKQSNSIAYQSCQVTKGVDVADTAVGGYNTTEIS